MAVHSQHPTTHEHGLADDCPRCAQHAAEPFIGLDDANLAALVERTVAWMRDEEFPRSDVEAQAMSVVETAIVQARRLLRVYPSFAEGVVA